MGSVNVCFLHAPSIYDFRKRDLKEGPISDVVPSTPVFEMYPVGFISMLSYLVRNGFSARISNLAVLMLSDRNFSVEKYIRRIDADIFGIDLHWLPHTQGAFEVSKLVKKIHPESKVVFGGFSSSYFAEDILQNNASVDYILAGDFMEEQIRKLALAVEDNLSLETVPNLVYRANGTIKRNPRSDDPDAAKKVFIDYKLLVRNAILHHDIRGHLPYYAWVENPVAMTILQRGCQFNCGFCGGSHYAYSKYYNSVSPVRRDPEIIGLELEGIHETINSPVFMAGDLNATGEKYYTTLLNIIRSRGLDLPLLTEYFVPPPEEYFATLKRFVPNYACEISPDSSDPVIRRETGRFYSNHDLEKAIENAAKHGSKKFDVYFSIGLPGQDKASVLRDADYLESIMKKYSTKKMPVYGFISPLTPFLDPGSLFYEMPDRYGYTISARGIMDYYNLLDKGKIWHDFLNYENKSMSREDLVEATYLSGIKMVESGTRLGYVDSINGKKIVNNILSYMNGEAYTAQSDKSKHLTYLVKEIDWSRKHGVRAFSMMLLSYSLYETLRRAVTSN
jgi:B12-binding domain/radical SAM domain protein